MVCRLLYVLWQKCMSPTKREGASNHVLNPFWYNHITIFERLCRQRPDTAKWLPIRTSHTKSLQMHYVSGWSPFMVMNGAAGVTVQHMSPYNTCELDAPSPRFSGLMRSWLWLETASLLITFLIVSASTCPLSGEHKSHH